MNFEQIMEIERKKIDRMFEIAEEDTERGRLMREHIDKVCWEYTHR